MTDISILIGPYNPTLNLISHDRNIPYLVTSLQEMPPNTQEYEYIYHMLPPRKMVHTAVLDLMESFEWEEVAIIYDNQNGRCVCEDWIITDSIYFGPQGI